eukprot:TRINITY_DN1039_c1_g1_i1.p1 TRINITY_DN1039_c1_g1~~TRINITY_DN1039_c1_g1_i1.p1  ORF type:complete len:123 (-),score=42.33 TRINITY_DN1039_c1_g1_i1:161-529(-)
MNQARSSGGAKPRPPEKGSFPLDHDAECKELMQSYLTCLRANRMVTSACMEQSKLYLQCRMDKGLMSQEEFTKLGFGDNTELDTSVKVTDGRRAGGLIAGMTRVDAIQKKQTSDQASSSSSS